MAEAIWKAMGGHGSSAGVSSWSDQPAAAWARVAVKRYGGTLEHHRSRDLEAVIDEPDLVLTMTESQRHQVVARRPGWAERTFCLGDFVGEPGDIMDPIGQDQQAYQAVADHLHSLLMRLNDTIDQQNQEH